MGSKAFNSSWGMEEVQRRYLEEISAYIDVMEKMKNPVTKEEVRA